MLRLPKTLAGDARYEAIADAWAAREQCLYPGGKAKATHLAFGPALIAGLAAVRGTGHLVQGLETIEQALDREKNGLDLVREKTGQSGGSRLARLIFLAGDGSERFLRQADAVLSRHGERAYGCVLAVDAAALGAAATSKGGPAKAIMIDDRKALTLFLAALVRTTA